MSDNPFHVGTHSRISDRVWDTVSKLAGVDWLVLLLVLSAPFTAAWIGVLLWAAFNGQQWAPS